MDHESFAEHYQQWVRDALTEDARQRQSKWTESVAVGSKAFIEETKQQLSIRAKGRKDNEDEEGFELRETGEEYDFEGKNSTLSPQNTYFWDDSV